MTSFRGDRIPLVSASPFLTGRNPMSYLLDGASLAAQIVKNLYAMQETGSIPGSRRFPGEGDGNPPQYSCLENSMDRGA